MATNLFKRSKRDWNILGDMTKDGVHKYARDKVKPDLEAKDNGYQIKFPFHVIDKEVDATGTLTVSVEIPSTSIFIRETDNREVYAASLFTWLDKGIDISHARLITNPDGSEKVIASKRNFRYPDPYEPKNWTIDVAEYHQKKLPILIKGIVIKFLNRTK